MRIERVHLAAKVWSPDDEAEPDGLFNKAACPDAPPNWFREEPDYAAELFALERKAGCLRVFILDAAGVLHRYETKVAYELTCAVRPVQESSHVG